MSWQSVLPLHEQVEPLPGRPDWHEKLDAVSAVATMTSSDKAAAKDDRDARISVNLRYLFETGNSKSIAPGGKVAAALGEELAGLAAPAHGGRSKVPSPR